MVGYSTCFHTSEATTTLQIFYLRICVKSRYLTFLWETRKDSCLAHGSDNKGFTNSNLPPARLSMVNSSKNRQRNKRKAVSITDMPHMSVPVCNWDEQRIVKDCANGNMTHENVFYCKFITARESLYLSFV